MVTANIEQTILFILISLGISLQISSLELPISPPPPPPFFSAVSAVRKEGSLINQKCHAWEVVAMTNEKITSLCSKPDVKEVVEMLKKTQVYVVNLMSRRLWKC